MRKKRGMRERGGMKKWGGRDKGKRRKGRDENEAWGTIVKPLGSG